MDVVLTDEDLSAFGWKQDRKLLLFSFREPSWELNGTWGGRWAFVLLFLTPSPSSRPGKSPEPGRDRKWPRLRWVVERLRAGAVRVHTFHRALCEEDPGWCPKIWTLFLSFYPDLSSMLLSSVIYIVMKAGILLDKIVSFHMFFFSPPPSLSFILFFFHTNWEHIKWQDKLDTGDTESVRGFALKTYTLEENTPSYFLESCNRKDSSDRSIVHSCIHSLINK